MTGKRFLRYVNKLQLMKKNYLLQEWIALRKIRGRPFDNRVFVQKKTNKIGS
ncbi:hypothetical protein JCM19046_3940 [Bacillus sp. JCM 19046]|nr:hypothetical protein JCM19046_3940 [Bacillus sp. JCM 19046]